ncbi:hypothetical protein K501DRAFT_238695 [Backusella circina FSU 941]|nr:hypothetical protein K501DRAFT_238695 [Backusella circina FSU 941]
MSYNTNYTPNYHSIVEPNDTSASSISSIPALSVFSELGPSLDETRPLLTNSTQNTSVCPSSGIEDEDEHANATIASTSINLSNTILGTGMLAMPAALASVGLIPGIMMIMYAGLTSALGLYFLARCAEKVGGRNTSFASLSKLTWPRLGVFFDIAIAVKCFGVAVSYLIIIGDLMPQVLLSFFNNVDELYMDRRFWITIAMVTIVAPLSFLRRLDSLKYTSIVALVAVVYLVTIVVYHFISPNFPPAEEIEYFTFSTKVLGKLPVFIFAFTCHQNIFSVYNELRDNSEKSVLRVIGLSIGSAAFIYELVAVLGYISFGKSVKGNIILEYPQSYFVAFGRLAIVILVIFSYPLQAHPCRACLDKVLDFDKKEFQSTISKKKYILITSAIIIISYLIAITVTELDLVLAFVGSTGSTTISFILPGLFYFRMYNDRKWHWKRLVAAFLVVYGFFIMTVCLSFNIIKLF